MNSVKTKAKIALLRTKLAAYEGVDKMQDTFNDMKSGIQNDSQDQDISENVKDEIRDLVDQIEELLRDGSNNARNRIEELLDMIERKMDKNK